jgi:hypothetical protein
MANKRASQSAPEFRHYCAYGLAIRSELPLPLPKTRGPTEPGLFELEIRASDEPLSGAIPEGVKLQRNPLSGFDFGQFPDGSSYGRWDDVGEVLISKNGRSIACRPFQQTDSESFYVYLLGQALSFALVKSGFEPLHATAVVVEDQAVAFLGDCGFGKSTLAAAFLQAGHRLLTDDLLLLRTTTRGILAHPGPARIKLFPEMARKFLGEASSGVPMNPKTQKLIIPLENDWVCADAAPLAAIYVLAPPGGVTGREIRVVSISQREAFVILLGSTFNYVITDPDRLRRLLKATQALADATIVRKLSYPRSLESLHLVREAILADLCAYKSEIATCER